MKRNSDFQNWCKAEAEQLKSQQVDILRNFFELYLQNGTLEIPQRSSVFSIEGARGTGKTTTLNKLQQMIAHFSNNAHIIPSIDSLLIDEDQGLFPTVINQLIRQKEDSSTQRRSTTLHKDNTFADSEGKSLDMLFKNALYLEDSMRALEKEMSMTSGDYISNVRKSLMMKNDFYKVFISETSKFIRTPNHLRPSNSQSSDSVLVISLDDLDLAPGRNVLTWFKTMAILIPRMTHILWIVTYHKENLHELLSFETRNGDRTAPALVQSLVFKVIMQEKEYHLNKLATEDRLNFKPLDSEDDAPTLHDLLKTGKIQFLIAVLPETPRNLEAFYYFLKDEKISLFSNRYNKKSILLKLASIHMGNALPNMPDLDFSVRDFELLKWDNNNIDDLEWLALIQSCRLDVPLIGLRLPPPFEKIEPLGFAFSYFEIFCNETISAHELPLLMLLDRLRPLKERINNCSIRRTFHARQVTAFFEEQPLFPTMLYWQNWEAQQDKNISDNEVTLTLNPYHFWTQSYQDKPLLPLQILSNFFLNRNEIKRPARDFQVGYRPNHATLPPRQLRALLLLVDAMCQAPWQELQYSRRDWSIADLSYCTAGFLLSSYALAIYPDPSNPPWIVGDSQLPTLFFPARSPIALIETPPHELPRHFQELCTLLQTYCPAGADTGHTEGDSFLYEQARQELRKGLRELLKSALIKKLIPDPAEQPPSVTAG